MGIEFHSKDGSRLFVILATATAKATRQQHCQEAEPSEMAYMHFSASLPPGVLRCVEIASCIKLLPVVGATSASPPPAAAATAAGATAAATSDVVA